MHHASLPDPKVKGNAEKLEDFGLEIEEIERKRRNFLRKLGWDYTCDTPGSLWMYEKKMENGKTLLVNESTAIHIALREAYTEDFDEDEEE